MKRALKWLAGIVAAVVLLVVCAAVVLPLVIDPNDYKPELVEQVKKRTGRDLSIEGDIALSVFPWIGIELGKTTLSNAPGFEQPVFAGTEAMSIRVKLLPLFARRLEMDTLTIHGLELNLARNANGRTNWDDLAAGGAPESEPSPAAESSQSGDRPEVALALGGVDIRDASLSWDDAASGRHYQIRNLSARTGPLNFGEPVDFELALDVRAQEPPISGNIVAEGEALYDAAARRARIEGFELEGAFSGDTLPEGKASVSVRASNVEHDGGAQTLLVEALRVAAEDLELSGDIRVSGMDAAPVARGTLSIAEFNPKELLATFSKQPLQTADPQALTRLSAQATIDGAPNAVTLKSLTVRLDDSTLTGELGIADLASRAVRFDLDLDTIDADRYMPPEKKKKADGKAAGASTTAGATAEGDAEPPNEALRRLDVIGRARIGKLKVAKLNMSDVDVSLEAQNGVIRVHPVDANLYGGTYRGNIVVDARGRLPRTEIDENLQGVQAGPLLADLQGDDRITGLANVNVALHASGATADAVKKSLNGSANFAFTDGAIKGVNIARMIREAYARIKGAKLPPEDAEQKTDFSEMRGTMRITDGVARNEDFTVMSPLLRINGKGTANLPAETVDYRVKAVVVKSLEGQGGEGLDELVGIPVPIHVTGGFAEPKYALDTKALAEELGREKVKEKVTETIDEKIGDEKVKGLLKGLIE